MKSDKKGATSLKYPDITSEYESSNVPGLYFAGTVAHGPDWRQAAGGFIHVFRYTAKALARILQTKLDGVGEGLRARACEHGAAGSTQNHRTVA